MEKEFLKEFSEGFMHDLTNLILLCCEGNTNTVSLSFTLSNGQNLNINITFSVEEEG